MHDMIYFKNPEDFTHMNYKSYNRLKAFYFYSHLQQGTRRQKSSTGKQKVPKSFCKIAAKSCSLLYKQNFDFFFKNHPLSTHSIFPMLPSSLHQKSCHTLSFPQTQHCSKENVQLSFRYKNCGTKNKIHKF